MYLITMIIATKSIESDYYRIVGFNGAIQRDTQKYIKKN